MVVSLPALIPVEQEAKRGSGKGEAKAGAL
jgi:hypothetical protein